MSCQTERRPVLRAYDERRKVYLLYQPDCKTWGCEYCAVQRQKTWVKRIRHGIQVYSDAGENRWSMVTLTSHRKNTTFESTVAVWPKAWKKLSARMRRKFVTLHYCLLPEQHLDGRLHVHMLQSSDMTLRWVKDNAPSCGLGYMVDVRTIDSPELAAWYGTKYISKSLLVHDWPKRFRRVRTSQKWPTLPGSISENGLKWEYLCTYYAEGMGYLAHEEGRRLDVTHIVIT